MWCEATRAAPMRLIPAAQVLERRAGNSYNDGECPTHIAVFSGWGAGRLDALGFGVLVAFIHLGGVHQITA